IKRNRPVVVAQQSEEALHVIEKEAKELNAPMILMGRDFDVREEKGSLVIDMAGRSLRLPTPSLVGTHQFRNAGLAVAAALTFDPTLSDEVLGKGISSAVWPARMQKLTAGPLAEKAKEHGADLWLDGGHNPHAGRALAESIRQLVTDDRPLVLIVGMFARKDAEGFFKPFAGLRPRVITTVFDSPNAANAEELAEAARRVGLPAETAADVTEAVTRALLTDGPAPHILICGGLHFAGEVLAMSEETWPT
ncbi:MAG: cyanophycin synthetase, partial [Patescibacteria group bacterium]